MSKASCPFCGTVALKAGASKCPACRRWLVPQPPKPMAPGALWAVTAALVAGGAAIGAAAVWLSFGGPNARLPGGAAPAASGSAAAGAPAGSGAAAAGSAAATHGGPPDAPASSPIAPAPDAAPAAAAAWAEPRALKLAFSPVDVAISDDGARLFVLGQDGVLRVIAADGGREERRVPLPNRTAEIRLLGGRFLAALGAPGPLHVVDAATFGVTKLDAGGDAVDVEAVDEGRAIVAAAGQVATRFAAGQRGAFKAEGSIDFQRPIADLIAAPASGEGAGEVLAIVLHGKEPGAPGAIELLDPRAAPFGVSRIGFELSLDRGAAAFPLPGGVGVVDRGATQLVRAAPGAPLEIGRFATAPAAAAGAPPPAPLPAPGPLIGAFRLLGKYVVAVGSSGTALVVSEADGALVAALPLGAPVSDAAVTADGRALLVALGGGARGKGAETAVLSGDPPAISARLATGAGSRAVAVARSAGRAVVAATGARTVAVLERR